MTFDQVAVVAVGSLATDLAGLGFDRLAGPGELSYGGCLHIGAGGKTRNIAHMIAVLLGKGRVAMIGRTTQDPYNLWRVPVKALEEVGVNCELIKILPFDETAKFPTVALIPVSKAGANQIYVMPGINEEFPTELIKEALPAFRFAAQNKGMLAVSAELPMDALIYAIQQANECGLRVLLDPGGVGCGSSCVELLKQKLFVIKPNEHEAEILTGVKVDGLETARQAAEQLLEQHVENVLITHGSKGAYLVNAEMNMHIPVPHVEDGEIRDETGCGDQTMAALCAALQSGCTLQNAARDAVLAGTLQFHKAGISLVSPGELAKAREANVC